MTILNTALSGLVLGAPAAALAALLATLLAARRPPRPQAVKVPARRR